VTISNNARDTMEKCVYALEGLLSEMADEAMAASGAAYGAKDCSGSLRTQAL